MTRWLRALGALGIVAAGCDGGGAARDPGRPADAAPAARAAVDAAPPAPDAGDPRLACPAVRDRGAHCLALPGGLPRVALLGKSLYDAPCAMTTAVVDCRPLPLRGPEALEALGWGQLDAAGRRDLALRWTLEVLLHGTEVVETGTPDFDGARPSFTPPTATATPDGGVVVSAWVEPAYGLRPEGYNTYVLYRATFGPTGESRLDSAGELSRHVDTRKLRVEVDRRKAQLAACFPGQTSERKLKLTVHFERGKLKSVVADSGDAAADACVAAVIAKIRVSANATRTISFSYTLFSGRDRP